LNNRPAIERNPGVCDENEGISRFNFIGSGFPFGVLQRPE